MSMLSESLKYPAKNKKNIITAQQIVEQTELAIAWLEDKVSFSQIRLGVDTRMNVNQKMATWLKQAYKEGKLLIK